MLYLPTPVDGACYDCDPTDPCASVVPCHDCDPPIPASFAMTVDPAIGGGPFTLNYTPDTAGPSANWDRDCRWATNDNDIWIQWPTFEDRWLGHMGYVPQGRPLNGNIYRTVHGIETECDPSGSWTYANPGDIWIS